MPCVIACMVSRSYLPSTPLPFEFVIYFAIHPATTCSCLSVLFNWRQQNRVNQLSEHPDLLAV